MKKLIYTLVIVFVAMACDTGKKDGVKVSGTISDPVANGMLVLTGVSEKGLVPLDSVSVDATGTFSLTVPVQGADFYRFNFFDRQSVNLILNEAEPDVVLDIDGSSPRGKVDVVGSTDTRLMQQIDSIAIKRQSDIQLLNQEALQARQQGNVQAINDITEQYYYLNDKHNQNLKDLIWSSRGSLAGIYGMNYLDVEKDFGFADSLATAYQENYPEHLFTRDLVNQVSQLRKLSIGTEAPEISLPQPDGTLLTLSSLKGNYVLIDFWAAWCRPCRMENPNVVALYNQYKDKNFEILGVSLDRKRDAWLKAIEDDGLIWKHVSDLKYFQSEGAMTYQINAIPATYLIDPEGKIMAKGLRGESLKKKLKEIFG